MHLENDDDRQRSTATCQNALDWEPSINVAVTDGKVILSGNVHSSFERDEARRAAWAARGGKEVEDHIAVVP